jgi:2-alkyl-3-oxoalkanoate reductase
MKLLITGASGFLGQYVVVEALRRGHQVRAIVRSLHAVPPAWGSHPQVEWVQADLLQPEGLAKAVQGVEAVIHLAAMMQGDYQTQYAGTVIATQNLLKAMQQVNVARLVAISSFSVFDFMHIPTEAVIDETSPLEQNPTQRDIYAQMKLLQEQTVREFEQRQSGQVTLLRPGMIYGRNHLWNAHVGMKLSDRLWLQIGANGQMPLTYAENCAEAIVLAAETEAAIGQTINIVDDALPTQRTFVETVVKHTASPPRVVPLDWAVLHLMAQLLWQTNTLLFRGKLKLPGLLIPARLQARFKPFRYSNAQAKQLLNWMPRYSFQAAVERSCSGSNPLATPVQTV